jgi:hypothetical protein
MADFNHIYGAGMRNGYIRTADGDQYDIDATVNIEGDPSQDDTEIKGDDTIKATFSSGRKEDLTITANAVSMDVLQAITGNSVSSSAGGSQIAIGTQSELNPPFVEVGAEINARTDEGTAVFVRKVWHKVQLGKSKITAGNGNELAVELTGSATQTDTDIVGGNLASARVATLFVLAGQSA